MNYALWIVGQPLWVAVSYFVMLLMRGTGFPYTTFWECHDYLKMVTLQESI